MATITVLADATFLIEPMRRLFLNVDFLRGYTTFSGSYGEEGLRETKRVPPSQRPF